MLGNMNVYGRTGNNFIFGFLAAYFVATNGHN